MEDNRASTSHQTDRQTDGWTTYADITRASRYCTHGAGNKLLVTYLLTYLV